MRRQRFWGQYYDWWERIESEGLCASCSSGANSDSLNDRLWGLNRMSVGDMFSTSIHSQSQKVFDESLTPPSPAEMSKLYLIRTQASVEWVSCLLTSTVQFCCLQSSREDCLLKFEKNYDCSMLWNNFIWKKLTENNVVSLSPRKTVKSYSLNAAPDLKPNNLKQKIVCCIEFIQRKWSAGFSPTKLHFSATLVWNAMPRFAMFYALREHIRPSITSVTSGASGIYFWQYYCFASSATEIR